jgi:hypothetical protein
LIARTVKISIGGIGQNVGAAAPTAPRRRPGPHAGID